MPSTLADLYTRYSARLATYVTARLDGIDGDDPANDTDDVLQDVWVRAAELDVLPPPTGAWTILALLAEQVLRQRTLADHRVREIPSGMALPAVRILTPAPMSRIVIVPNVEPMTVAA